MLGASRFLASATAPKDQHSFADHQALGTGLNECEFALAKSHPVVCDKPTFDRLYDQGICGVAATGYGALGGLCVEDVCQLPRRRFEFCRDYGYLGARRAIIIPAHDETGDLVDRVAWNFNSGRFLTWRGVASMLGGDNICESRLGEPLLVHESIAGWLRAGRSGVFILDARRAAGALQTAEPLRVLNGAFGRQLKAALTIPAPRIVVSKNSRRAG